MFKKNSSLQFVTRNMSASPENPPTTCPKWNDMPDVILIKVLAMLPVRDRLAALQVCRRWHSLESSSQIWHFFDYERKYFICNPTQEFHNIYCQIVSTHGVKFRNIHLSLFCDASYEIIRLLREKCINLKCIDIEVIHRDVEREAVFKEILYALLFNNFGIKELTLRNVNFYSNRRSSNSTKDPLPNIGHASASSLLSLTLIRSFLTNDLTPLVYQKNLKVLTIDPQQLQGTWLSQLARSSLHTLNIVGEAGKWEKDFTALTGNMWQEIVGCSNLQVNCYLKDFTCKTQLLMPGMPLNTLVWYDQLQIDYSQMKLTLFPFSETLTTLVDVSFTTRHQGRMLANDDTLVDIVKMCTKLKHLAVKSCLCSSTLLLMVQLNSSLTDPMVHEDLILYHLHLPPLLNLPEDVLKYTEQNYVAESFQRAMSEVLGFPWKPFPASSYFQHLDKCYNPWKKSCQEN